jgi:hypothetical protein
MDLRGAKSNVMSVSGTDWNCNCPFVAPGKITLSALMLSFSTEIGTDGFRTRIPYTLVGIAHLPHLARESIRGLHKSVVLANRLNLFWGLDCEGIPSTHIP